MPKPAHTGSLAAARTPSRYRATSPGTDAVLPVVPVMVTAYTNPWLAAQSLAMRAGCVTGVTIWMSARPCGASAARKSSPSSNGRSGTMNPQTPALAASAASCRNRRPAAD